LKTLEKSGVFWLTLQRTRHPKNAWKLRLATACARSGPKKLSQFLPSENLTDGAGSLRSLPEIEPPPPRTGRRCQTMKRQSPALGGALGFGSVRG